jgi:hypothetical protein
MYVKNVFHSWILIATVLSHVGAFPLLADLLVYEPFDYNAGSTIDSPLNGGMGFANAWIRAEEGSNDTITVTTGAPGSGNLDGVFDNAAVTTTPTGSGNLYIDGASGDDRITANRVLSQSAGALAGADKVLWASILWTMNGNNYGRQVGFTLGTDGLKNRSQNISTNATWGGSGDGDAMGVGGGINSNAVTPTIWDDGATVVRTTTDAKALSTSEDNIVILKFVFADDTTPDTVYAWGFGETDTITEAAFDANAISASAVIDQDLLNVLSFGQSQVGTETIDEIRLGDTFDDVTTGVGAGPRQPVEFTGYLFDLDADRSTLTWTSNQGEHYGLYWSEDLVTFTPVYGTNPAIPAHESESSTTYGPFDHPILGATRLFFKLGDADFDDPALNTIWGNGTSVTLTFSEAMHAADIVPGNFAVAEDGGGALSVTDATLSSDGTTVTLTLASNLAGGTAYTVTMNNLTDPFGRELGNGSQGHFQTWDNDPNGIKVFILAGQSNMVGHGKSEQGLNDVEGAIGSLRYLAVNDASFPQYDYTSLLVDPGQPGTSDWAPRSDVQVWWKNGYVDQTRTILKGDLDIGYDGRTWFGPDYAFGQVLGDYYNEPVLIIKAAWGGIDLATGFRPPSAVVARGGNVGAYYTAMIDDVREVLSNLSTEFPAWAGQGYQIVGFGWHQGWNDRISATYSAEYEENLVDLIADLRAEFSNSSLPVVIGTTGMAPPTEYTTVELAQLAVDDGGTYPQHDGSVFTVDTRPYWRDSTQSPSSFGYHWNHNGESHFLVGKNMGDSMVNLLTPDDP